MNHTYAGPMYEETVHFLDTVCRNKPVLVKPESKEVMDLYTAADLSVERGSRFTSCK